MAFLRSLSIWIAIGVLTVLFGLPSIFAAFIPPRGDWYLLFARGWARTILGLSGVRVTVRGAENVPPGASVIYCSNHESFYDIFVLLAALPGSLRFLAKRSLFRLPVLGWSMAAAGFIPVDRGDRRKAAQSLEIARRRLTGGKSVLIFPEQTRTRTGEMLPFKKGGALLAVRAQLPIVPVAIAGTFSILQRGGFWLKAGPVRVEIGRPIPTSGLTAREADALAERCRDAVAELREQGANALPAPGASRDRL